MHDMPHAYTNRLVGDEHTVIKHYQGPDAPERRQRECAAVRLLNALLPVPRLLAMDDDNGATFERMPGVHAQKILRAGKPDQVLGSCGVALRQLHQLDLAGKADTWPGRQSGKILVHGDFGPNNVLVDPDGTRVTALLDWEWAHFGEPIEDLAWCEWIVRSFHPEAVRSLDRFFAAYGGEIPSWEKRKAAMVARCAEVVQFTRQWEPASERLSLRERQLANTQSWRE